MHKSSFNLTRREVGFCSICWTPFESPVTDFQLSGPGSMAITDNSICCAYGTNGQDLRGFDCLVIPADGENLRANRFCGASKGLASIGTQTARNLAPIPNQNGIDKTICCKWYKNP